ncbi:MAG: tetratricopeptide repeat protein [bacterium]|nr:tetratricopeptide repeat protein [bacterium]
MKKKCAVCGKNKGARICERYNNQFVCSLCCAEIRNSEECESCQHFKNANQYQVSKIKKIPEKHFIAEINPQVEDTVNQALTLVERGDIEKGQAIITDLKEEHPINYMVHYALGVVHAFKGELDEAIRCFEESTDIFPYFIEAYFNKGIAYQKKYDIGNTTKAFKEVIAIGKPESNLVKQAQNFIKGMEQNIKKTYGIDIETYIECQDKFDVAFSCMKRKEWEKAIDGFKASLVKSKRHPQSYGNIGLCYACLGQKEQALEALDKAIEIDPNYEPAIFNRTIIEFLGEGEKLGEKLEKYESEIIEYYKERALNKKSFIQSIFKKLTGKIFWR